MQDQGWEDTAIRAIEAAAVVVIVPTIDRDEETGQVRGLGTLWELKHLVKSGRIDRTLALMPKNAGGGWEQARAAEEDFGLKLPPYKEGGCVVTFERASAPNLL